jgi:glycosyltransferase involved in cell wall biosynthesis
MKISVTDVHPKFSILLLGTQMAVGGAQKVLLDLARWFHERGHAVTVAFFYDKEDLHAKWQQGNQFPIVNLKAYRMGAGLVANALSLPKGLWLLWRLLRSRRYDVVETFTHDSNILGVPLAWLAGIPVRIAINQGSIEGLPRWRERLHTWLVNHKIASILVAVSERMRQTAMQEGIHAERIAVIQNAIVPVATDSVNRLDVREELGVGENEAFILSVGRLVHQKAHEFLVAAMPAVLREFPNTKVGICGDGFLHPQLDGQIKSLGLESSVKLLGRFDDVTKFLAAADVFALPSRWEGLPIALLEAMSVGLAVVATPVAGVDEVVVNHEHGLLVPVGNVSALSDAIVQLLRDPQLRCKLGAAAKQRVIESYSTDQMGERYLSLMESILANRS